MLMGLRIHYLRPIQWHYHSLGSRLLAFSPTALSASGWWYSIKHRDLIEISRHIKIRKSSELCCH
uniref:Uncharacterized protein n=1 Tax=Rhizophora mucronata TaxID=61149 RepID=A0A2P2NKW1_RHIMU